MSLSFSVSSTARKAAVLTAALSAVLFSAVAAPGEEASALPGIEPVREIRVFKRYAATLALSPDGRRMAVSGTDVEGARLVRIYDLKAGRALADIPVDTDEVISLKYSPNGKQLAVGSFYVGTVNAVNGRVNGRLARKDGSGIRPSYVEFTPDGRSIWSFEDEEAIQFSSRTLREIGTLSTRGRRLISLELLPRNRMLAVGYANTGFRLFSLVDGKETVIDPGRQQESGTEGMDDPLPIHFMEYDGGRKLAVSRYDTGIELWDLEQKTKLHLLDTVDIRVDAMAVLGDGRALVAPAYWITPEGEVDYADYRKPLTVFDLGTRKPVALLKQDSEQMRRAIFTIALSDDGKELYVPAANGTVQVFDVSRWATADGKPEN